MKVIVGIKRVVDPYVKVRVRADGSGVDLANAKMAINPFCEIAVEEAIRMKEAGTASEVIVVSVGPSQAQEQLRTALALGADRGILVESEEPLDSLAIAKLLKVISEKESADLVIKFDIRACMQILANERGYRSHFEDSLVETLYFCHHSYYPFLVLCL